jgi:hypothetical protein
VLGWACLLLASAHCALNGWEKIVEWEDCGFPGSEQLALLLPALTLAGKLPLLLPWVDTRLSRIRRD